MVASAFPHRPTKFREKFALERFVTGLRNKNAKVDLQRLVINGKHCSALIDSGASLSLVSPRLCPSLPTTKIRTTIYAVNGTRINATGSANIVLKIAGETLQHPMVVTPELPWDVILGVDFLSVQKLPGHRQPTVSNVESQNGPAQLLGRTDSAYRLFVKRLINRFWDVFAWDGTRLGRSNLFKHRIDTQGAPPIRQAPRRVPVQSREELRKIITDMLREGVVKPSQSPWASPIGLVKKEWSLTSLR
ncbi:unnamed protein product [Echinostoma caproni]|uniref:Peptidase A2 domain-containing protein n=1 Tax=Echinostoma caproni TaxID=27848 RepID=A0A3P8LEF3_9TREM|nr:unnamed protein product [Echinostoma caproni]